MKRRAKWRQEYRALRCPFADQPLPWNPPNLGLGQPCASHLTLCGNLPVSGNTSHILACTRGPRPVLAHFPTTWTSGLPRDRDLGHAENVVRASGTRPAPPRLVAAGARACSPWASGGDPGRGQEAQDNRSSMPVVWSRPNAPRAVLRHEEWSGSTNGNKANGSSHLHRRA